MRFKIFSAIVTFFFLSSSVFARTDSRHWCGSQGTLTTEYFIKNHEFRVKEQGIRALSASSLKKNHQDIGEIAVIKSNPATLSAINPFDLKGKKITFTKNPQGGFNVKTGGGAVSGNQGTGIVLADDDSEQINFTNGFNFQFYGTTYNSVFINSDGNLTFKQADTDITDRNISRIIIGPPRIAPFFQDMNPSARGQVRVLQSSTKFTVTWNDVSQFLDSGTNSNTFQINLFKNGNIEFIYSTRIDTRAAVVGISQGNTTFTNTRLVNYSTINLTAEKKTILERFATTQEVDFAALLTEFHQTHPKVFDFVVVWTDFPALVGTGAFAFYSPIQNNIRGIGDQTYNFSKAFGSPKIQGVLMMDNILKYPQDPNTEFLSGNSTIEVFGQENGHRWLAFPRVSIAGQPADLLLGRQLSHWSFFMDTDASCMEGNDIRDNGNGSFTTVETNEIYSKLDKYMMGFLPPSAVPNTFIVTGAAGDPGRAPQKNVTISGTKQTISIQDIIRAEGARVPNSGASQKRFREAFIFFTKKDTPAAADIARVDRIRTLWATFWRQQTGNSTIDTTLP
jgi:hypothetical protein